MSASLDRTALEKRLCFEFSNGDQELDSGVIVKSQSLRMAYLSQHDTWEAGETGNDYLSRTSTLPLWQVKAAGSSPPKGSFELKFL